MDCQERHHLDVQKYGFSIFFGGPWLSSCLNLDVSFRVLPFTLGITYYLLIDRSANKEIYGTLIDIERGPPAGQ